MISQKKPFLLVGAALALVGFLNSEGRADSILATLTSVTPSGSNFAFTYDVRLTGNSNLMSTGGAGVGTSTADFFSFLDVGGFVSATGPANFAVVQEPLTTFPGFGLPLPTDSPLVTNVRFNYTGPMISNAGNTDITLGNVTLISTVNTTTDGVRFIGQDRDAVTGTTRGNTDAVLVPTVVITPGVVPLPAPLLGGIALFGLLGLKKLRKPQLA